jgi:hypothetical protein
MPTVWKDLAGTLQTMLKFGSHRLFSNADNNAVEVQSRFGTQTLMTVGVDSYVLAGVNFYAATEPPTTGDYTEGSIVWNKEPSATGIIAWYCQASGTPGSWLPINSSGQLSVQTHADLLAINPLLLKQGYIAYVIDEGLRYEYLDGNWVVLNTAGNLINYQVITTASITLGANSSYIHHLDPNGESRDILIDTGSSREFKILNLDGAYPLRIMDGETAVFELSTLSNVLEATVSFSNNTIRVSTYPGALLTLG